MYEEVSSSGGKSRTTAGVGWAVILCFDGAAKGCAVEDRCGCPCAACWAGWCFVFRECASSEGSWEGKWVEKLGLTGRARSLFAHPPWHPHAASPL